MGANDQAATSLPSPSPHRAYRVTKAQPEREDPDGARARADGLNPLPSQPCLP
ncbi:hypothetical protein MDA_GLEAN10008212 [Myotis davidii]|uniref:Uncharacterized protein n=1 Tax=Myotis davidii TaxID=225400 RepID=L5LT53_MYODS|nr:hypothetical protein MDA_GLEAN10008212 [Myotis davidii]